MLFFPQLIAGPIVHYREMMPQFQQHFLSRSTGRTSPSVLLCFFGLFKKAVLADNIATLVTPIYNQAAVGGRNILWYWRGWRRSGSRYRFISIFRATPTWRSASPAFSASTCHKTSTRRFALAVSLTFWLRWHMTLTRFLTAYIYNPLTLWLTRRRMAKGSRGLAGAKHHHLAHSPIW